MRAVIAQWVTAPRTSSHRLTMHVLFYSTRWCGTPCKTSLSVSTSTLRTWSADATPDLESPWSLPSRTCWSTSPASLSLISLAAMHHFNRNSLLPHTDWWYTSFSQTILLWTSPLCVCVCILMKGKGFVHWTLHCGNVCSEIQQPCSKYFIVCLIFVISLCHMYIINSQLPPYSVLHGVFVCISLLDTRQFNLSCADSAPRLLYGLRRVSKHASPAAPVSQFHGDESKPETIGALFKPLYRGNMLTYELLVI